jgi:hypothetical protein
MVCSRHCAVVQHADYKRSIGYDFQMIDVDDSDLRGRVPKVRWLRVEFASATMERAPPQEILASYEAWNGWANEAREVWMHLPPAGPLQREHGRERMSLLKFFFSSGNMHLSWLMMILKTRAHIYIIVIMGADTGMLSTQHALRKHRRLYMSRRVMKYMWQLHYKLIAVCRWGMVASRWPLKCGCKL